MDWLADIFKQVTLSRSFTVAALITSAVLLFGPKAYPNAIDAVPPGWNWAVIAVFVFTASLSSFWFLKALGSLLLGGVRSLKGSLPLPTPSGHEDAFLYALAQHADRSMDLDELHHRADGKVSKLELLDISKSLRNKGYVNENTYNENLVSLTDKGRQYALRLETRVRAHKSPNEA